MSPLVPSLSPRTGAALSQHTAATAATATDAVAAAARAHAAGVLAPLDVRARLLRACAAHLEAARPAIVQCADDETGLGTPRLTGELTRTTGQLSAFADLVEAGDVSEVVIDHADPERMPPMPDLRRMLVPLGPVAVFGAGNFPLAFGAAGGDVASAFAAGCPVVVKGHASHPGTGELVARAIGDAFRECGLEAGVYSHLLAAELEVGHAVIDAPQLAAVAFTGSLRGGSEIALRAALRTPPIPVFAEMGSTNPLVLLPGALEERFEALADGLTTSLTGSAGQLCTKPGLVLVPQAQERFADGLAQRLLASGDHVLLDRRLLLAHRDLLAAHVGDPVARISVGGAVPGRSETACLQPFSVVRTTAAAVAGAEWLREEIFGPAVVVATFADTAELCAALRALDGQLTGTIHAEPSDEAAAREVAEILRERVGRLIFNGYPTGVPVAYATVHGGPWPATNAAGHTSVGMTAARRFVRPLAFQDTPEPLLPPELHNSNPLRLTRRVDGVMAA